jgi:hypothetical protein
MPREWETFFFMVGSSATGLIGLLFVVITLTSDRNTARAEAGSRTFVTPTVVHFTAVLFVSAIAVMPGLSMQLTGQTIGIAALLGFLYVSAIVIRLVRAIPAVTHWTDYVFYGLFPVAVYLGLMVSAAYLWSGAAFGPYGIAIAALALLVVGIRDAWDLATYLAYHRSDLDETR